MAAVEQRQATRLDVSSPISIWLGSANRFFQGHSLNVSQLGVLVSMPMSAPVRVGQDVQIDLSKCSSYVSAMVEMSQEIPARVVRVSRRGFHENGMIEVALRFQSL